MNIIKRLKIDEGFVPYAYQDSLGFWTIGNGTLIDKRGGGITEEEAEYLLRNRVEKARKQLVHALNWTETLDPVRFDVLLNMAFNMGIMGLMGFTKTLGHVKNGDYLMASITMLQSRWAKQVGNRASRLSYMMERGVYV